MAYSLLAHGSYAGAANGGTSGAFDIGNPDLIVVFVVYQSPGPISLSDSSGNTYLYVDCPITIIGSNNYLRMYYCAAANTTVTGGGSVTFTMTGTGSYPSLFFLSYTGSRTSSDPYVSVQAGVVDGTSSDTVTNAAISSTAGSLLATGLFSFAYAATSSSIDSGFTVQDQVAYAVSYAGASGTKISTGASETVTWTITTSQSYLQTMIAEFAGGSSIANPPKIIKQAVNRASTY